jgi:hypothetical protein
VYIFFSVSRSLLILKNHFTSSSSHIWQHNIISFNVITYCRWRVKLHDSWHIISTFPSQRERETNEKMRPFFCACKLPKSSWTRQHTLRYRKVASILFIVAFFRRFLGIIHAARLAMCNVWKCSKCFIVFNYVNSFPIEQF